MFSILLIATKRTTAAHLKSSNKTKNIPQHIENPYSGFVQSKSNTAVLNPLLGSPNNK
jgi:hypothetical protein